MSWTKKKEMSKENARGISTIFDEEIMTEE
jgi:hypothetical protein